MCFWIPYLLAMRRIFFALPSTVALAVIGGRINIKGMINMAVKRKQNEVIETPQVPPLKGIELLRSQIEKGKQLLKSRPLSNDDFETWETLTRNYLEKAFGKGSPNVSDIMDIGRLVAFPMNATPDYWEKRRFDTLTSKTNRLEGLIELLKTEIELSDDSIIKNEKRNLGHRVFIVHGHSEATLHETARYLEKMEQEVIVLRELPNAGNTIIEKFEEYSSDVGFAIVLLTPDDKGCMANDDIGNLKFRARQNVIFELGYFIGKLGRNRVCALYHSGVEIPSDYSGVLFITLDSHGAWRLTLAKEMKAAGLNIDMNKAL
jgi:predicted nucleotide-binding protein